MGGKQDQHLSAALYEVISRTFVRLADDMKHEPATAERLLKLISDEERAKLVWQLVREFTPPKVDHDQMLEWLERRSVPANDISLPEPAKGKSARGAYHKALNSRDDVLRRVATIEKKLAAERAALVEADAALEAADAALRASSAWMMLSEINRQSAALFAMGPAWSLMRIASGHVANDPEFEERLGERRREYEDFKAAKGETAGEILYKLDMFSGDVRFETKVHMALHRAVTEYSAQFEAHINKKKAEGKPLTTAEKRIRRNRDEQKDGVHPRARTADRGEVLDGIDGGRANTA